MNGLSRNALRVTLISLFFIFLVIGIYYLNYFSDLKQIYKEGVDGVGIGIYFWPVFNEKVPENEIMSYANIFKIIGLTSILSSLGFGFTLLLSEIIGHLRRVKYQHLFKI